MPLQGLDNVKKMIAKNKREANIKVKAVFLDGLGKVIAGTPVGLTQGEVPSSVTATSGYHRNNWFLGVGFSSSLIGREPARGGAGSYTSLASMPNWVLNKKLYFTNNGPAIEILEYGGYPNPVKKGSRLRGKNKFKILSINGFSGQADKGWVRSTLIAMANKIRAL